MLPVASLLTFPQRFLQVAELPQSCPYMLLQQIGDSCYALRD
jgi:hypothetical protein